MRKKILTIAIICLLIVSFSLNVFSVNEQNDTNNIENNINNVNNNGEPENKTLEEQQQEVNQKLQESNNKLNYVQSEMSTTLQKVEELEDSTNDYQKKYDDLEAKINSLSSELEKTNNILNDVQEKYDRKERLLKKRVVALYEAGDTAYIDLLLSSNSIVDFISNYFMIGELVEYDDMLLQEIDDVKGKIEKTKAAQEKQQKELKTSQIQINRTKILLDNTRMIKENYIMQLSDEEKVLQQQIEQYKIEQAAIEAKIIEATYYTGPITINYTGGVMIWPITVQQASITSPFGNRLHPIQGVYKNHTGMDISASGIYGTPVVAALDGIVTFAGVLGGYGNCVMINHGNGIVTLYGHGSEINTTPGALVKQGDVIMKVGSTGMSTGPHLHFEVRINGTPVDPLPYLNGEIKNILDNYNENNNGNNNVEENNTIDQQQGVQ